MATVKNVWSKIGKAVVVILTVIAACITVVLITVLVLRIRQPFASAINMLVGMPLGSLGVLWWFRWAEDE